MRRYARHDRGPIPYRLGRQLVAARYGTTPTRVDGWPADDYLDAVSCLDATAVHV
jgi:hypothetical protein